MLSCCCTEGIDDRNVNELERVSAEPTVADILPPTKGEEKEEESAPSKPYEPSLSNVGENIPKSPQVEVAQTTKKVEIGQTTKKVDVGQTTKKPPKPFVLKFRTLAKTIVEVDLTGKGSPVGVVFKSVPPGQVDKVTPKSVAEELGVRVGWNLVQLNGKSMENLSPAEVKAAVLEASCRAP